MEPLSANDPRAIGEFALRARLGSGGMGRVYLGFSPGGRAVAIKVVHPELARDPEFLQRFGREVAAARTVSGVYTAPVIASGLNEDPPWMATAFVPGPPLSDVVSRHGPLPETALWRLAAGLAEALHAVHACNLVHRDLKPSNVLLAPDGPHVIDFGISRAFEGTALTSAGMVVGTPGYMSPEQAEGQQAGPPSDVFSLGCVLAYAATGIAPFGGGSAASVLYRVVTAEPDLRPVPEPLRRVIAACLGKNAAERAGLSQLTAMISALGPAAPVALGSFWPEPVASFVAVGQVFPTPTQVSSAPVSPAQSGWTPAPTLTSLGGMPQPGMTPQRPAPGGTGHAPMVADGYYTAAASGLNSAGAAQPNLMAPGQPRSPPAQSTPWPPSWPGTPNPLAGYTPGRRRPTTAEVPGAVLSAVRLMYLGAVTTLLYVIFGAIIEARDNRFATKFPRSIAGQHAHSTAGVLTLTAMLGGSIGIVGWLIVATASRRGDGWTRVAATVLLALHTVGMLTVLLATHNDPAVQVTTIVVWVVGLAVLIQLWGQQSSAFFRAWRGH